MHRFWEKVIKPILAVVQPSSIVEIGSLTGLNTVKLLDYCKHLDAVCYVIDPHPRFEVEWMKIYYREKFELRQQLSLEALPELEQYDLLLIDGDHNYYTVYHELKHAEDMAKLSGKFPVILLHDTAWPYGRRDMYYAPDNVPEEQRQPCALSGIVPGSSALVEGAFNHTVHNALTEYGERNGVLTAVEDFVKQSEVKLKLYLLHSNNGLGILLPEDSELNPVISFIVNTSGL